MCVKFVILSFLFLFVSSETIPCLIWRNSFAQMSQLTNNETDHLTVRLRTLQTYGWFSIGFSSSNESFEKSLFILFQIPNKVLSFQNHTKRNAPAEFFQTTTEQTLEDRIDGISSFSFKVNKSTILNKKYVFFANFEGEIALASGNQTFIPKHQHFSSKPIYFDFMEEKEFPLCEDRLNFTGRFMARNFGLFFIANGFYVLLMILYIYFRNDQPLKSRFIIPFLGVLFIGLNLLSDTIGGSFDYETNHKFLCMIAGFISYPLIQIAMILVAAMMIRYQVFLQIYLRKKDFVKKNLSKKKSILSTSSGSDSEVTSDFSKINGFFNKIRNLFLILQSPWTFPIIAMIWLIIFMIGQFLIFGLSSFQCKSWTQQYMIIWSTLGQLVLSLITAFVYLFDILFSLKHCIRCRWKTYFIEEDPFFFRLDFLILFLYVPILFFYAYFSSPQLAAQLISDTLFALGLMINGGTALIFTMVKRFFLFVKKTRIGNKRNKINIEEILKDEVLLRKFIEFAESEWAGENVYFMVDVQDYKRRKDMKSRKTLALQMRRSYLIPKVSPLEINVTAKAMNPTLKKIEENDFPLDLFEKIEREVEGNTADTISRFIVSSEYGEFIVWSKENNESLLKLGNDS
jgi:hypothetical protein